MHKPKILFFDIDGTLIDMQKKCITPLMLSTLHKLQANGIRLAIATGRSPMTVPLEEFPGVQFDVFITFNGSYCYDKDRVLFASPIPTEDIRTLRRALLRYSGELGISSPEFEGCYYLSFKMDKSSGEDLPARLLALFEKEHTTVEDLVFESESPSMDKYDPLLPPALLRKAYAKDRLDLPTLRKRLEEWSR